MLYPEYIQKVRDLTIRANENNGKWYLIPDWRFALHEAGLENLRFANGYRPDFKTIEDSLKLEVERRNLEDSKKEAVINWIYETITATVEPAILQEETDYIKQVVEFMKANHANGDTDGDDYFVNHPAKE